MQCTALYRMLSLLWRVMLHYIDFQSCSVVFCAILSCPVLLYSALSFPFQSSPLVSNPILYSTQLYSTVFCYDFICSNLSRSDMYWIFPRRCGMAQHWNSVESDWISFDLMFWSFVLCKKINANCQVLLFSSLLIFFSSLLSSLLFSSPLLPSPLLSPPLISNVRSLKVSYRAWEGWELRMWTCHSWMLCINQDFSHVPFVLLRFVLQFLHTPTLSIK